MSVTISERGGGKLAREDYKRLKYSANIERLAMVGDKTWENGMSASCRPFTSAKVRYFDLAAPENGSNIVDYCLCLQYDAVQVLIIPAGCLVFL